MLINEYDKDIVYPDDLSRGAQITFPSSLLNEVQPNGELVSYSGHSCSLQLACDSMLVLLLHLQVQFT